MSLLTQLRPNVGRSGFGATSTAEHVARALNLRGQTWLITGVTSGLGRESARVLSARGARILATGRQLDRTAQICQGIAAAQTGEPRAELVPLACELTEPDSIRACIARVGELTDSLHGVMCNAGVMALPRRELVCGQEAQFFTNHVAHFMLTVGLLPRLAADGSVVVLSSSAHRRAPRVGIDFEDLTLSRSYQPWLAYGQSKLANLLFARSLAKRFEGTARRANAVHPGVIATRLTRHLPPVVQGVLPVVAPLALKSVAQGAATQVWAAVHPGARQLSGEYLVDCNVARSRPHGRDEAQAGRLWSVTQAIVDKL